MEKMIVGWAGMRLPVMTTDDMGEIWEQAKTDLKDEISIP